MCVLVKTLGRKETCSKQTESSFCSISPRIFLSCSETLSPPSLSSCQPPPPTPLALELLCSLDRNDSLCLWINEDSIHAPVKSTRSSSTPLLIISVFSFFFFFLRPVPSDSFSPRLHHPSWPLFPLSHPLSCYIYLPIADSYCPFIAPSSLANPASLMYILSPHVCSVLVVYCGQVQHPVCPLMYTHS